MIILFLLNCSGQAGEQRNNSLQISVSGLELLPHVVAEMRMYDCWPRCKGTRLGRGRVGVDLMPYLGDTRVARGLTPELTGSSLRALEVVSRQWFDLWDEFHVPAQKHP